MSDFLEEFFDNFGG